VVWKVSGIGISGEVPTRTGPSWPEPSQSVLEDRDGLVVRTYRVQVTGQFDRPASAVRERLLAEQSAHDVFASAFVAEGTFSYAPTLTRFTLRYLLDIDQGSAADADMAAELEGEILAGSYLEERDIPFKALTVSVTCMQDVKVRRRQ